MSLSRKNIIYDSIKNIREEGNFTGSLVIRCKNDNIIFSEKVLVSTDFLEIPKGLLVGFEKIGLARKEAFSKSLSFKINFDKDLIDYCILMPEQIIEQFDNERFSDAFPYTLNLLHSSALFLNEPNFEINHIEFFKGEILNNPVALLYNGILVADRVVINHNGDPIFYGAIIIGRDNNDDLSVSYESIVRIDEEMIQNTQSIIILGTESIRD